MQDTTNPTGDQPEPGKPRRTRSGGYGQNWAAYNKAQQREWDEFRRLLFELSAGVETPRTETGRPWLPWRDLLIATLLKCYLGLSGRRLDCHLNEAYERGYLSRVPHFNTLHRFLGREALTPCLKRLVRETSLPLTEVERVFAADSTGLSTCRYRIYFNRHRGKSQRRRKYRKLHAICGVTTNVITWAEVSDSDANDSPFFKELVGNTALHFRVAEVSADAGYHAASNQRVVLLVGGIPYIAYKSNSTEFGAPKSSFFKEMLQLFREGSPRFTDHYNKRNNAESTFFMVKSKFGGRLRGKTDRAQINEALCLVICHNLCVLVQSIFELGLTPTFWTPVEPRAARAVPAEASDRLAHITDKLSDGERDDAGQAPARPTWWQPPLFGPDCAEGIGEEPAPAA